MGNSVAIKIDTKPKLWVQLEGQQGNYVKHGIVNIFILTTSYCFSDEFCLSLKILDEIMRISRLWVSW